MKRAILIIGVILMGLTLRAQSVTYTCRYWFDKSDTQVATTEFIGSLWEEELDVGTLTYGLHTLHLQVMDASMNWSAPESFLFLKLDAPSGLDCHYWFDQDFEGKQVIAFNSTLLLDVDALDLGMHTLHILLKGTEYTSTESYLFLKADTPEQIESYTCHYWFDQDFANAQSTDFGDGNLLLNVTDLTDGIHTLHLTLEGTTLTSTESYLFAKVAVEDGEDVTYRYWFDRDLANSETFVLTDGIMLLDVSALDNGLHSLHLMKEGSSNSSTESYLFVKIPVEDPEAGMQYHCWFDQDYNTVQTGEVGNGVFLVNVGALTVGEHELVLQFDDGNRYSPEAYTFYRMPMVTVSINPVNAGLATSSVEDDTICTLNAEPNVGYDFVNWTQNGEVVSADPNYTFNLTEDAEFVANFVLKSYDITATANPADGGTIEGDGVHFHFSTCTLTATANTGYHFLNWTQDGVVVSESETFSFEVEGPASYVANFEVNSYEITATVNPNNVGTVEGMGTYEHFSTCTLTATPNTGYHFVNWTMNGQVVSSTAAYSFTVTGEGAYVANFELNSYEITVAANPEEGGTVEGAGTYQHFSECTLTATPNAGYSFVNWTKDGEVVANSDSYTFEVTEGGAYVANFSMNTFEIFAFADPEEGGTVEGAGIYAEGATATLMATANEGYEFMYWTDMNEEVVSYEPIYSFEVFESNEFVAHFELIMYEVIAFADPEEGGYVEGGGQYPLGDTVTLEAFANEGFSFVNWTNMQGEVVSTQPIYTFTVTDFVELIAHFEIYTYEIIVIADPEEGGTVEGGGIYNHGETCTLTATANPYCSFLYWTKDGDMVSTSNPYSFTVTGDGEYVAWFSVTYFSITAIANPSLGGDVTGDGEFMYGQTCTLTATANEGYEFLHWTDTEGEIVSYDEEYSFTVTEDAEYEAVFELMQFEIVAYAIPQNGGEVEGGGYYAYGATCTLTATPYENFIFVNWTEEGEVVSASDSYTFEVMDNRTLVANFEYVSPLETDYITDGMILYLDGILNTRDGHSTTTEVWEDLIGNNDVTVNGYSSYTWEDNHFIGLGREGYLNTGKTWQYFNSLNGDLTIEIVTYIDCDKTWPEYRGLIGWHVNSDGMHAQNDQGSNRMQTLGMLPVEAADDQIATVTYTRFEGSYLNGVWGAELNSMPDGVNSSKIAVFGNSYSQWRGWNDSIYCIRMYNRTLTPEEIAYNHSVDIERFGAGFPTMYYVFANANPDEGGTVEGFGDYAAGSTCTLIATPNEGFEFLYWVDIEGEVVSYDMEYSFTVTGDAYYYAVFELGMYEVLAFAEPEEGGEVEGGGYYAYGDTCTLIAMPNEGYQFLYWLLYDDVVSTEPEYSFEVFETVELRAIFESSVEIFYIEAFANPEEGGSVSGSSYYFLNDYCTLLATPNEGYVFVNWTKDGEVVSTEPEYVFEVLESGNYVANFQEAGENYWTFDPFQYPDNMSVTGIVQIEGEEQRSEALEVGAFCNDECRGTARPVYNANLDRYIVYLTVYGEDGDNISFKLYDHSIGEESDKTCMSTLVFESNGVVGNAFEPYVINFIGSITQTSNLSAGWNWWSAYVELGNDGLTQLQSGLGTSGEMIKSQNNGYASYLAGFGWYGSLTAINNQSTYQVKANAACTVELTGNATDPADYPITLNSGWSWVGYPVAVSMSVIEALSGIEPMTGDMLKSQNNGYASYLAGFGWYGSLNTLQPGMGLMYKSNNGSAVTLVYPNNGTRTDLKANQTADNNHWRPNLNAYPDNMSVMAVVELDGNELEGENFELAAFANGTVRGSARLLYVEPLNRYMAFLTVAGEDAAELRFGLYNAETGEECIDSDNVITYVTNAVVGSFAEPYVVSFRGTTGTNEWANSLNVYPNPVQCGQNVTIGFIDVETSEMRVEIINAIGAVVETMQASSVQTITAPETAGVYTLRVTVEGKGTCYRKLVVR